PRPAGPVSFSSPVGGRMLAARPRGSRGAAAAAPRRILVSVDMPCLWGGGPYGGGPGPGGCGGYGGGWGGCPECGSWGGGKLMIGTPVSAANEISARRPRQRYRASDRSGPGPGLEGGDTPVARFPPPNPSGSP